MKRAVTAYAVILSTALTLGCHAPRLGSPGSSCASGRCDKSQELVCTDGSCSVGDYASRAEMAQAAKSQRAAMAQAAMANAQLADGAGAAANYQVNGGQGGPLADMHNRHHVGPQSHLGAMPGPAMGPPAPTVTYPYYTTRGPRDYFLNNPPTIGR